MGVPTSTNPFERSGVESSRLSLILGFNPPAGAAPGDLDPSFDGDGNVTTNFTRRGDHSIGIAIQPDGKIIMAGVVGNFGSNAKFGVVRYNGDGSLDSTFGGDGTVSTDFPKYRGSQRRDRRP
jgi:uncharacterized delta-60 repeat protein